MRKLACIRRLRTSSCPRYQPFDANPDQTTDWHLAEGKRFCEIFDELLSTQKMLGAIPSNHGVKISSYSERSASTAFTLAARAAGTAEAITAAPKMTIAEVTNASAPG